MSYGTSLPEKKILGIIVVNYTAKALLRLLFLSMLMAGVILLLAANLTDFGSVTGLVIWLALTPAVFVLMMMVRDKAVRWEIEQGRHYPVWGKHICRQLQREADALQERHWLARPLFRLACLLGLHKDQ